MSRTWTKWRYRNWGGVPATRFMVGATYPCTWRKVYARNHTRRYTEADLADATARLMEMFRSPWEQALRTAGLTHVEWKDPAPIIGYVDEGLHYRQMLDRAELHEWRP